METVIKEVAEDNGSTLNVEVKMEDPTCALTLDSSPLSARNPGPHLRLQLFQPRQHSAVLMRNIDIIMPESWPGRRGLSLHIYVSSFVPGTSAVKAESGTLLPLKFRVRRQLTSVSPVANYPFFEVFASLYLRVACTLPIHEEESPNEGG